ncbi:MAG: DNA/RNA non-specific endonuclease [Spirochaetia bacterium]|nr:DNA/RNA non-specific endonuclease [Spirochaetia bacterium]
MRHTGYTLSYSEEHEQAEWVAYKLTIEELQGDVERTDNFREDKKVDTETASLSDYRGSGYDRGHLAPAADFSWSEEAMSDTFYLSNMSPQKPGFNRGIWRSLESQVREWAIRDKALLVVTGPVFERCRV